MKPNTTPLRILLVISLIWAGLNATTYLMLTFMLPTVRDAWTESSSMFPTEWSYAMEQLLSAPRGYYLGLGLLSLIEVLGCALMWRLRWPGFHCYTLARLLMLLLPVLFLGSSYLGVGDIMFAALWILVYYLLMKRTVPPAEPLE